MWKVCDFGLASPGTSKRCVTTAGGRGTASYRAPELLRKQSIYNNKTDVFAMGCILFELATFGGRKAFADDIEVHEHYKSPEPIDLTTALQPEERRMLFRDFLHSMLAKQPLDRPPARELTKRFAAARAISVGHAGKDQGQYELSIVAYRAGFEAGSTDTLALNNLAYCYQATGRNMEAMGAYELAINGGFKDPPSLD